VHALESLFGLAGRTALVTGGSRGIGRSACLGLAQAGAAVAVHYGSDAEAAAGVVAEIEAAGGRAAAFGADLSRPELIAPLLAAVGEFAGESGLGVLVNNAGIYPPGSIESLTVEEWDRVFAVNARAQNFGEIAFCRDVLEQLVLRARCDDDLARIVNELRYAIVGVHDHGAQPVQLAIGDVGRGHGRTARGLNGDALASRQDRLRRRDVALIFTRFRVGALRRAQLDFGTVTRLAR